MDHEYCLLQANGVPFVVPRGIILEGDTASQRHQLLALLRCKRRQQWHVLQHKRQVQQL